MEPQIVAEIIGRYEHKRENILGVLEDIQDALHYLPESALKTVAESFQVSLSQVYSLATFYKSFSLKPKGKHHICVCTGTACYVRGAEKVIDKISQNIGIAPGDTTPDAHFSLETVNCLGACALGPLVVVDTVYHGNVKIKEIDKLLGRLKGDTSQPSTSG